MADFGVPPPYREPLTTLAKMPDDQAAQLVEAVSALDAFASVSKLQEATQAVLGENASAGEKQLALPFLALRGQLRHIAPEAIAERLSQSLDLKLDEESRAKLRIRATAILDTAVLATTAVAADLQTQNVRNYQGAKIVTDLRPVFTDHVDEEPAGAVIVETLQLQTWGRDGASELIFVSMDEADLKQLMSIVGRALKKTETLRKFIKEKGLAYFELEKEAPE